MSLHVTIRTPSSMAMATDPRWADDTLARLRRLVMLGADLMFTADIYAWGLDQESAAFRDATVPAEEPITPPSNWPIVMARLRSSRPRASHPSRLQPDRGSAS